MFYALQGLKLSCCRWSWSAAAVGPLAPSSGLVYSIHCNMTSSPPLKALKSSASGHYAQLVKSRGPAKLRDATALCVLRSLAAAGSPNALLATCDLQLLAQFESQMQDEGVQRTRTLPSGLKTDSISVLSRVRTVTGHVAAYAQQKAVDVRIFSIHPGRAVRSLLLFFLQPCTLCCHAVRTSAFKRDLVSVRSAGTFCVTIFVARSLERHTKPLHDLLLCCS